MRFGFVSRATSKPLAAPQGAQEGQEARYHGERRTCCQLLPRPTRKRQAQTKAASPSLNRPIRWSVAWVKTRRCKGAPASLVGRARCVTFVSLGPPGNSRTPSTRRCPIRKARREGYAGPRRRRARLAFAQHESIGTVAAFCCGDRYGRGDAGDNGVRDPAWPRCLADRVTVHSDRRHALDDLRISHRLFAVRPIRNNGLRFVCGFRCQLRIDGTSHRPVSVAVSAVVRSGVERRSASISTLSISSFAIRFAR